MGFSGPTQHCYGFGPRGRGFLRGGRGGMNRGPWSGAAGTPWNSAAGTAWNAAAPTWNAMMRGWMGEQPACRSQDKKKDDEKKKDEKHEKTVKAAQEASKEAHEQAHSAAQAAAASAAFSFPTMTGPEDYLQNVGSFVAAALDPLGIDVKIDIETPEGRKSCHVSRQASTASTSTSAGQEQDKEKKEGENEKEEVVINEEKKEDSAAAKKAATPSDDEEDWTVVTDKKDDGATGQEPSLYPTLTENSPVNIPSAPVASHPDPKIQAALQAMMNMGFSNDGGWLSSLLEAKNGDIGKVLDILQPVKK